MFKKFKNKVNGFIFFAFFLLTLSNSIYATSVTSPFIDSNAALEMPIAPIDIGGVEPFGFNGNNVTSTTDPVLQLLFLVSFLAIVPSLLLMLTCFTRIIICFHFLRSALGTQQMPPNQVLLALALFITFYLMAPTFNQINEVAIQPYVAGELNTVQAVRAGMEPMREFMFNQVENQDLALFANLDGQTYETRDDIPSRVLIPAFMLGEITKGFKFGFIVFVPFLVIDMVVASILMAMGMMMLPPAMISLPFKILFFVMVDGWSLMIGNMILTFNF